MFNEFVGKIDLIETTTMFHQWGCLFSNGHKVIIVTDGNGHIIDIIEEGKNNG